MGQYFIIVNTDKKQYLSGNSFGEGVADLQVLTGYHSQAIALLMCRMDEVRDIEGTLLGSWSKDDVIATGEYAESNKHGIITSTETDPERNLYKMAKADFEDISYKALAMLCETHETVCYELAEKVSKPRYEKFIFHLGNVINQLGCEPLETALNEILGDWKQLFEKSLKYYENLE
jgi:hypothetical protein